MNINKVHVPERLENETMVEYRQRQQLSKRLGSHMRVVHDSMRRGTYFKDGTHSAQRTGAIKRRAKNSAKAAEARAKGRTGDATALGLRK
jgi:hypothetical protein